MTPAGKPAADGLLVVSPVNLVGNTLPFNPLRSTHVVRLHDVLPRACLNRSVDLGIALLTSFGSNENYPVGGLRSVDGGGGGILQYLDGLDILGIDVVQRRVLIVGVVVKTDLNPVHNIERIVSGVDGTVSTDIDFKSGSCESAGGGHLHTGSASLQDACGGLDRYVFEVI